MNWKRIWTGTLCAGIVVFLFDCLMNGWALGPVWRMLVQHGIVRPMQPSFWFLITLIDVGIGFVLMWLYALVRPRLGPGPKTALLMGGVAWSLLYLPSSLMLWIWFPVPSILPIVTIIGGLLQCWTAIYVAGWQYMEKAP